MEFSGVMLGSDNPTRLGEFYAKILGPPDFRDGDWYRWEGDSLLMIGAHSEVTGRSQVPQRMMLMLATQDIGAAVAACEQNGATVVATPAPTR